MLKKLLMYAISCNARLVTAGWVLPDLLHENSHRLPWAHSQMSVWGRMKTWRTFTVWETTVSFPWQDNILITLILPSSFRKDMGDIILLHPMKSKLNFTNEFFSRSTAFLCYGNKQIFKQQDCVRACAGALIPSFSTVETWRDSTHSLPIATGNQWLGEMVSR